VRRFRIAQPSKVIIKIRVAQLEMKMEAIKIITPAAERKPCVCGATICVSRGSTNNRNAEVWLCARHCGARGLSYEGALRRKVRLDLLSWGDLRRNAQALIAAHSEDDDTRLLQ
jgi:hypothetical protein